MPTAAHATDVPLGWTARLGRRCAQHPRRVVAAWLLLAVVLGLLIGRFGPATTDDLTIPGADSQAAIDVSRAAFPDAPNPAQRIVVTADALTGAEQKAALDDAVTALETLPEVASATAPTARNGQLSDDGTIGTISVVLTVSGKDITRPLAEQLTSSVTDAVAEAGISVAPADQLAAVLDRETNRRAELIGLVAALVILLVAFGSVAAALLPLGTAIVGLAVSILALGLLGYAVDIPAVAPSLASMIGLGVGIDYALFGLNRFQRALVDGQDPVRAATTTTATAGRAVLFAGFSVIAALSGLALVGMPLMRSLAIASGLAVLVACVAAVTLLPAMLAWLGPRLATRKPESLGEAGGWARLARRVARRPWAVLLGSTVVLGLLAAPALDLRLGQLDAGSWPTSTEQRQSYDLLSDGFGPGANGPLLVTATYPSALSGPTDPAALALAKAVQGADGVAAVTPPQVSDDGLVVRLSAQPTTAPSDPATQDLVASLRSDVLPAAAPEAETHVGGFTAGKGDLTDRISSRMVLVVGAVVLVATLLLLVAFRAPIVALKAALMNLLSVGAAYGILVAVFTWGWGAGLLGLEAPVPIESYVPLLMFAVLFGLSTDYEVFVLTAVREEWVATGDGRASVASGMAKTGRVITSAALIMICVFLSFTMSSDPVIKMMGVGMAAAVAVDATIVRGLLVPSTMTLLGDWNWWLPAWLDRLLPHVHDPA
ncbi:MMPL family transporter [Longivirga aurantiaca]|uniref:MMPL family transporter n=1 Tax=Longivirga aurantiaca TaxID=1837743 RepID=A0ABW1T3T1_9ACTN